MTQEIVRYEITKKDIVKDRVLRGGALALPFVGAIIPSLIFFISFLFSTTTPFAGMFLILSLISAAVGFVVGGVGSGVTMLYRSRWLAKVRERVAIDGIRTEEVSWFKNELKSEERKALKEVEANDLALGDAYRETLASRLTATRIIKSTNHELVLAKRRRNKLKYLKSERLEDFRTQIEGDIKNLSKINKESKEMELEAESRLQMIEAASRRGTELAGSELALKKLSSRSEQLPLALEAAKMEEEIKREIERETAEIND
jgi:hypothetical protein